MTVLLQYVILLLTQKDIALVKNNARIGSQIAKAYSALQKRGLHTGRPLIIGGTVLDISAKYNSNTPFPSTSNPGQIHYSMGGVGRNVAEACFRTGGQPCFISVIGNDVAGDGILKELSSLGMVCFMEMY